MNKQEGHSVPVPMYHSFLERVVEEGAVGVQTDDQHDGVGGDRDHLFLSKLHVRWKTKVGAHPNLTCIYSLNNAIYFGILTSNNNPIFSCCL